MAILTPRAATPSVRTAEALGAAADARTHELHDARRVPDDLYRDAIDTGLFRQLVAADLGGLDRAPLEWFRTGVELARHEPSLSWVITQGAAELGWIAAGGDDGWAREVLADPRAVSASSTAGLGRLAITADGTRFSGRWRFNTGCHGASWIGGLAVVDGASDERGMPLVRWGWVPADRAQIVDDWRPSGLHGSGSHSTVIDEQEIDPRWTFDVFSTTSNDRGPYRTMVGNGNWPIAASTAAVQLGNARRALDEARAVVTTKAPMPDYRVLAANAAVQRGLTEAEGLWQAALASVERELEAMWDESVIHGELSVSTRVGLHRANVTASRLAVHIVDSVVELTGSEAVAHHHVLARCHRDAHALRPHISVGGAAMEHNAQVALGLEADHRLV